MPTSRIVLILYAFTATTNVMASANGDISMFWATKPLLMPLLVGVVWFTRQEAGHRPDRRDVLVIAGLLLATAGDVALMADGTVAFGIGLALFAGCHGCYLAAFARPARRRNWPATAGAYLLIVAAAVIWLWPGLGALAAPMTAYAVLLGAMAVAAAGQGWRVGLGAALFVASDLLIAVDLAGAATLPGPPIWVMLTYVVAQALIATGWAAAARTRSLQQVLA